MTIGQPYIEQDGRVDEGDLERCLREMLGGDGRARIEIPGLACRAEGDHFVRRDRRKDLAVLGELRAQVRDQFGHLQRRTHQDHLDQKYKLIKLYR